MTVDEFKKERENIKILNEVNKKFKPLNDEMDDYMRRHKIKTFEIDDYRLITLFEPIDKEKYKRYINHLIKKYKENEIII